MSTLMPYILSSVVGLMFAYAAVSKIRSFEEVVRNVGGMSRSIWPTEHWEEPYKFITLLLICCESAIAVVHLGFWNLQFVAPITLVLLAAFFFTARFVIRAGYDGPCLCFGGDTTERFGTRTLVRISMVFLAELLLSIAIYRSANPVRSLYELDLSIALTLWGVGLLVVVLASLCFSAPQVVKLILTRLGGQRVRSELASYSFRASGTGSSASRD